MSVPQNIIQYEGTKNNNKEKRTRQQLCASAIGICAIPPFNIGYDSHNTIEIEIPG